MKSRQVRLIGNVIVFRIDPILRDPTYEVPLDDCKTRGDLVDWIFHLKEKKWMTPDMLWGFLYLIRESGVCPIWSCQ